MLSCYLTISYLWLIAFGGILGAAVGSFLGVVIDRNALLPTPYSIWAEAAAAIVSIGFSGGKISTWFRLFYSGENAGPDFVA